MPAPSRSRSAMLFRSLCGDFDMVGIFTENPIKEGSLACIVSTSTSVCMERGRGAPSQFSAGAQPLQIVRRHKWKAEDRVPHQGLWDYEVFHLLSLSIPLKHAPRLGKYYLQVRSHLIFTVSPGGKSCCYTQFTDEETEA